MNEIAINFKSAINEAIQYLQQSLPNIILAILVAIIGFLIIRLLKIWAHKIINKYSNNPLITDFIANIIAFILSLLLITGCLSIIGRGDITNNILAGAGISTFVIGFALKDIGENFLAGILMAFNSPFRVGDLIEFQGLKGKVIKLSLRETTIKSLDGRDVYIPNGLIVKNPLQNYTIDNYIRNDFSLNLEYKKEDVEVVLRNIEDLILSFNEVEKSPAPTIYVNNISGNVININALYWIRTDDKKTPGLRLRGKIITKVFNSLIEKGYNLV